MEKMTMNVPTSFRLTDDAKRMINELISRLGVKRSQVIELAIRKLHRDEGLAGPETPPKKSRKKA